MIVAADLIGADLESPARRFDFFTFVAADVLGVRAAAAGRARIGLALLLLGMYSVATSQLAVTLDLHP